VSPKVGTLNSTLKLVAAHHGLPIEALLEGLEL
jgi:hypothetical protein